jgi:cytochrome c-type biogenesis protein CcmF
MIICLVFLSNNFLAVLAFSSVSLVLATIFQEWIIGTRNRIKHFKENIIIAFIKLLNGNRTKHGGYIVHLSILMLAMGIIGTNFYQIKADHILSKDKLFDFHNYQIELTNIETKNFADRIEKIAKFNIYKNQSSELTNNSKKITELEASNALYPSFNMASVRAGIHSTIIEDLYIVPSEFIGDDKLLIRISINPLISWLWFAGPIFFLGAIFTLWPRTEKH